MNKKIILSFGLILILITQSYGSTIAEKFKKINNVKIDLTNLKGQKIYDSAGKIKHKLIILHFWATWCPKCHEEMPQLDKISTLKDKNILILCPAIDTFDKQKLAKYYQDHGITHLTMVTDPALKLAATSGVIGVPTTLFINDKSQIIGKSSGAITWDVKEFASWCEKTEYGKN